MNRIIERLEKTWSKKQVPSFNIGDTVRVHAKVIEGEKERIQVFEGIVIGRRGGGHREMFTVRKISYGVGVERVFPVHSPFIQQIQVVRQGRVRRAKLYYLRSRQGRAAYVAEKEYGLGEAPEQPTLSPPAERAGDTTHSTGKGQETVGVKE
jgi:large subunit ribosomal protein L19